MQEDGRSVLDRFRHGDVDAFETLFRLHQPRTLQSRPFGASTGRTHDSIRTADSSRGRGGLQPMRRWTGCGAESRRVASLRCSRLLPRLADVTPP